MTITLPRSPVGTWRLISASTLTAGGRDHAPYGAHPAGVLMYTQDGRMSVIVSHANRQPLSRGDRISAPAGERGEAFATFLAYAGRYSLAGDQMIHHVEISSVENWVNTDLIRTITFEGDRIVLTTPPLSVGGTLRTTSLVWERVK